MHTLLEKVKIEMEAGNITEDEVGELIPPCKKCIIKAILEVVVLIIGAFFLGGWLL